jgi:hypothetical protein
MHFAKFAERINGGRDAESSVGEEQLDLQNSEAAFKRKAANQKLAGELRIESGVSRNKHRRRSVQDAEFGGELSQELLEEGVAGAPESAKPCRGDPRLAAEEVEIPFV